MPEKTLVFGASLKPERYSNLVIKRLINNHVEVVAYGLKRGVVAGVSIDPELKQYENIHTITLYMNPLRQKPFYNYLIGLKPKRVIFNPGTENPEFWTLLRENNIYFEVSCSLVLLSTNQY